MLCKYYKKNNMLKPNLKEWVLLITIVPSVLITVVIACYFSINHYFELESFLDSRTKSIITPIASSSVQPLLSKDKQQLKSLISYIHRNQSDIVMNIVVFTKDNQTFISSSSYDSIHLMRINVEQNIPKYSQREYFDTFTIYRTPIINDYHFTETQQLAKNTDEIIGYIVMQIDRRPLIYQQQKLIYLTLFLILLNLGICTILAFKVINKLITPITTMADAIEEIIAGNTENRISGNMIGELNILKNGINTLSQSISDSHTEMQLSIDQATIDLRESLEQFEMQNVELDIAKRKAQDANKVKSEFLANMSHELRTPLNGVIGFTRQVLKTPLSVTQHEHLQTIERSATNLLSIINDILDFSKLDAGKMVIESIPFSLRESVEEALVLIAPSAHKKNIELSLRICPALQDTLIGDALRIKQVLINLTNNAIKFTNDGSVDINIEGFSVKKNVCEIRFTIKDTGIGISEKQKDSIFEAFGQADKSITRIYGGTGLGLVISERIISEMHGDIGFESIEGQGSSFWFTIQCEFNPLPTLQINTPDILNNKNILLFEQHDATKIATQELLTHWNMNVTYIRNHKEFESLLENKQRLKKFDFALIGHDISPLPLKILQTLLLKLQHVIPSIHLAINSNSPSLHEALIACGAKSCISKPITQQRLYKSLNPYYTSEPIQQSSFSKKNIPIKVLAVDDNDANLQLIKELLLEQVAEVVVANDGSKAVTLCHQEKYDLIYMDIQMPELDGISALSYIREHPLNDKTPVIAVTAHMLGDEKDNLIKQGFNAFITKPIDEGMIQHTIFEHCDPSLLTYSNKEHTRLNLQAKDQSKIMVFDWELAVKRAGNRTSLAKDLLTGLVQSLPDNKLLISEALIAQDIELIKSLIHKLNGACCYTGVPNLGTITHEIETKLKKEQALDDLEPEFFEFFEQIDLVIKEADNFFAITSDL